MALSSKDAAATVAAGKAGGLSDAAARGVVTTTNSQAAARDNLANSGLSGATLDAAHNSLNKIYDTPIGVGGKIDTKTGKILSGKLAGQQATTGTQPPQIAPPTPLAPGAAATATSTDIPTNTTATSNLATANGTATTPGTPGWTGTNPLTEAENRFKATQAALLASGAPPPNSATDARTQTSGAMSESGPDTAMVDAAMQTPELTALTKLANDYFSPDNQRTSLLDQYNQMYKAEGLAGLDEKILNASNVINGTEDDIRNEIQKAGGFGTDSQVQAMAQSRNKVLLQNYNTLVEQKKTAEAHLSTMVGLAGQDRAYAQQQFTAQLGIIGQMATFRQQAINNVKEGFNNLITKVGYGGAYEAYKNDPQQLSMLEQTMGLPSGGLQKLSTYVAPLTAKEKLDMQATQANIAQSYASVEASKANTAQSYAAIAKDQAAAASTAQAKVEASKAAVSTADTVLGKVSTALKQTGYGSAGIGSGLISLVGGTTASNLRSTIDTIKANLAFTELSKMRAASPSGGALGAISDKEETLLSSTVSSLDASQSPSQLRTNLKLVKDHYVNYIKSLGYEYDEATGTIITP